MDRKPGERVGRYLLEEQAGAGGFAVVWKARPLGGPDGPPCALKIPLDEAFLGHLRREAEAARALADPQVVPVLEAHLADDPPHLVMPWIEGQPLALRDRAPPPQGIASALRLVLDLARVLGRVHAAGFAHGDVKPSNVLVDRWGSVHLLDFGLARPAAQTRRERTLAQSLVSVDGRSIAGTLDYLAPEVIDGAEPGPQADVYAAGVLLHQLLTGRPPAFGVAPEALNPYLPPGTAALLRAMLEADPARRLPDARAAVAPLERLVALEVRCLARRNGHARRLVLRRRLATVRAGVRALGLALLLVAAVASLAWTRPVALSEQASPTGIALLVFASAAGLLFLSVLALLVGVTTINALLVGVPAPIYKNRPGHPWWSFFMQ